MSAECFELWVKEYRFEKAFKDLSHRLNCVCNKLFGDNQPSTPSETEESTAISHDLEKASVKGVEPIAQVYSGGYDWFLIEYLGPVIQHRLSMLGKGVNISADESSLHGKVPLYEIQKWNSIAGGAFGKVYSGTLHGEPVAVKLLYTKELSASSVAELARMEELSQRSDASHLVRLKSVCTLPGCPAIVTEYVPGSLRLYVNQNKLPWNKKLAVAEEIAIALKYLQSNQILHCSLTVGNILIDNQGHCKIADFGLGVLRKEIASSSRDSKFPVRVAYSYLAPEVLLQPDPIYTEKGDSYSFGMILWLITTQQLPHTSVYLPSSVVIDLVVQGKRERVPECLHEEHKKLLKECWSQQASERPSLDKILERISFLKSELQNGNFPADDAIPFAPQ